VKASSSRVTFPISKAGVSMKVNVGIVTFPLSQAGRIPLLNLVKLFSRLADRVYVISGGAALENLKSYRNVHVAKVTHKLSSNVFMRIINHMHTQLETLRYVIVEPRRVDLFVFFIGGEGLFIPMLILKLLRKKVVLMPGGVATKGYFVRKDPLFKFMSMLVSLNFSLADKLIVYSHRLIQEANLAKYQRKIIIAHEHFVDFARFAIKKKVDKRSNLVGYIGRLSEEKGILNLIEAVPFVLKGRVDTRFVICGEGSLFNEIENIIKAEGVEAHVRLMRWIAHEDVPQYLNELRLLVLPSFTEGLPNVILEAMACGTPVLVMPVGAVPDIIEDGETGFLLKSDDSGHIADRIVELLGKPELLEKVSVNAYNYVRENFSYEKTLEAWRKILEQLKITN